ncbi:uncharacterized protein SAPINGB_P005267 [Magnusiomyces paraingens]|uniref:Glycoside hydrolase family 5 domain-containing protein n=1 Tax=Magnusiomyces paraingens TaxID=2606893 RepID=A0A5E8C1E8_9ASCO|nr:uncharacterized protein SAPINGB_P005267 [Saprochaete ingens]VVT56780.1 unnamed protein product [Saprochaete ingens]
MGFGSFIKNQFYSTDLISAQEPVGANQPPTRRQIYVNRLNKGVNLGGMFVLEKWIAPHMFPEGEDNGKTAEFDAIQAALKKFSGDANKVREMWETHWSTWISDDDWAWLASVGVTSVRLPIGYWNVDACSFIGSTDFDGLDQIYHNSWDFIQKYVLEKAIAHNIGVLIDVHAVPGGANSADHSGISTAQGALWESNKCQVKTLRVLQYLAEAVKAYENVVGIQVLNEAPFADDWETQRSFYLKALHVVREINTEIPVIISDGWDLPSWIDWVKKCDSDAGTPVGLILDEHVYRTFSDKDRNTAPRQLIDEIEKALPNSCAQDVDVQVGEFSCVMDGHSWELNNSGTSREDLVHEFGNRQCALFNQKAAAYYFWTYKFRYGSGGEWGFREMQEKGCLSTGFASNKFPSDRAPDDNYYAEQYHHAAQQAIGNHTNYWNSQDGNRDWQHWRFEDGFRVGWLDAQEFDKFNHSEIGRRAAWKAARTDQHAAEKGGSDLLWVFGQAFDQGVASFLEARNRAFN